MTKRKEMPVVETNLRKDYIAVPDVIREASGTQY